MSYGEHVREFEGVVHEKRLEASLFELCLRESVDTHVNSSLDTRREVRLDETAQRPLQSLESKLRSLPDEIVMAEYRGDVPRN
ncbi:MAG: hypothetical protein C4317_06705 [Acidimicrobiia bacterium]